MAKAAGRQRLRPSLLMPYLLPSLMIVTGCGGGSEKTTNNLFNQEALVASVGQNVILPALRQARDNAEALRVATLTYQTAIEADAPSANIDSARLAAQTAWKSFAVQWQQVEVYQIGPIAASVDEIVGAKNLRDRIYSWPSVRTCDVDKVVASKEYEADSFIANNLVLVYGLDALEYLLFNANLDHSCLDAEKAALNSDWATLTEKLLLRQRSAYATVLATDIALATALAAGEWEPAEGNFLGQLKNAGNSGSVYKSTQVAVDDIIAAMFYMEIEVKDEKLATPLAINAECTKISCPEKLESRWAKHSKENVVANLTGLQNLLRGGPDNLHGFDDVLATLGAKALADTIQADITAAIAAFEAVEGSLFDLLENRVTNDVPTATTAYAALKKVTDTLKGEFLTTLKLQIPSEGAGDSD